MNMEHCWMGGVLDMAMIVACLASANTQSLASPSPGCSTAQPTPAPGTTFSLVEEFGGVNYTHFVTVPPTYSHSSPNALILYFHGWGAGAGSCGSFCEDVAPSAGFMTVALEGMGVLDGEDTPSWNGFGSTQSPGQNGPTCTAETNAYCYEDCGGNVTGDGTTGCVDNCWWTTCQDSVAQIIAVLDRVQDLFCIDTTIVWATGCSNGGMFTFELARDPRMDNRLRGIAPTVGLPHNGFNVGPQVRSSIGGPLSIFGMWGRGDTVVPPLSNMNDSTKSQQTNDEFDDDHYEGIEEMYYSTARNVTELWALQNNCSGGRVQLTGNSGKAWDTGPYGIPSFGEMLNCTEVLDCDNSTVVVECLFDAGHECNYDFMDGPILSFILNQSGMVDIRSPPPSPSSPGGPDRFAATAVGLGVLAVAIGAAGMAVVVVRRQTAERALLALDGELDEDVVASANSARESQGSLNPAAYKVQVDQRGDGGAGAMHQPLLGGESDAGAGSGAAGASPAPWLEGVE